MMTSYERTWTCVNCTTENEMFEWRCECGCDQEGKFTLPPIYPDDKELDVFIQETNTDVPLDIDREGSAND